MRRERCLRGQFFRIYIPYVYVVSSSEYTYRINLIDVSTLLECWGKWALILMFGFIVYQLNKIVSSEKNIMKFSVVAPNWSPRIHQKVRKIQRV